MERNCRRSKGTKNFEVGNEKQRKPRRRRIVNGGRILRKAWELWDDMNEVGFIYTTCENYWAQLNWINTEMFHGLTLRLFVDLVNLISTVATGKKINSEVNKKKERRLPEPGNFRAPEFNPDHGRSKINILQNYTPTATLPSFRHDFTLPPHRPRTLHPSLICSSGTSS